MNFSVYFRDELGKKLQKIADEEGVSRNNLITEAVEKLVQERETSNWGEEVLNWQGCPEFELGDCNDLLPPEELIF